MASGVGVLGMALSVAVAFSVLIVLPLLAYTAGQEQGKRLRSITQCTDAAGRLLVECAEVTFEKGERVVGVYLAGHASMLALQVNGESVVYTQPIRAIRFGAQPRKQ